MQALHRFLDIRFSPLAFNSFRTQGTPEEVRGEDYTTKGAAGPFGRTTNHARVTPQKEGRQPEHPGGGGESLRKHVGHKKLSL